MNTCCEKCGADLNFYDHELIEDKNECISIKFHGRCIYCGRQVTWIEKYKFVETTQIKEIR